MVVIFDEFPVSYHHPCPKSNKGNFYRWYDRHQGNQECHHKQRELTYLGPWASSCLCDTLDSGGVPKSDIEKNRIDEKRLLTRIVPISDEKQWRFPLGRDQTPIVHVAKDIEASDVPKQSPHQSCVYCVKLFFFSIVCWSLF